MKHSDANGATDDLMAGGEFTEGTFLQEGQEEVGYMRWT